MKKLTTALALATFALAASCGPDPVYTRCVEEQQTYCDRLFACVELGDLIGVQVNYEDEDDCTTEETKQCESVSEANACPGGTRASYDAAEHDKCIDDQAAQSCSAFADRPSSCSSYCTTE